MMKNRTNLQVENETLKKLLKLKFNENETYDHMFNRLMEEIRERRNNMDMYVGEYLDRMSILLHKAQKIGPEAYPEFIKYVEKFLLDINLDNFNEAIKGFRMLYSINGEIWSLEYDLRNGKEKKLGDAEIGRRAIKIRGWNNKRIKEQNRLIKLFGGFKNIKKDHMSENK